MKKLAILLLLITPVAMQAQKYRVIYNADSIISVTEDDDNSTTVTFTGNSVIVSELENAKSALQGMGYNTRMLDSLIQTQPVAWHYHERPIRMKISAKDVAKLVSESPELYFRFLELDIPFVRNDTTGVSHVYFYKLTPEEKQILRYFGGELEYNNR
jgi:hypothetical protein